MSKDLVATNDDKALIDFNAEQLDLIKRTIAVGATDDELALFLHQARRMGLDPLAKQIHFQKFRGQGGTDNVSFITTIDGYRLIADRTGRYAGSDEPEFDGRVSGNGFTHPYKATVRVWKIVGGKRVPFAASAYWDEYYPGDRRGHMWRKMPHVMLAKVAEAAALRKAFPADLSGAYTREEMDQAQWEELPAPTVSTPEPPAPAANGNGKHADVVEGEVEDEPLFPDDDKPAMPTKPSADQMKAFHAAGRAVYGDGWDDKRAVLVSAVTGGRSKSSTHLTRDEWKKLMDGINKVANEAS